MYLNVGRAKKAPDDGGTTQQTECELCRQAQIALKIADSDEERSTAARFVKFLDERRDSR